MHDQEGRLLAGRFRLSGRLGSGGMGTVWRATDEFLERDVAVKEVTGVPEIQRTLREARASARLRHPGIVTVYDVVIEDGRPWIVMEMVPGRSLAEAVERDGPLPEDRVADIARQLLAALRYTHERGVVHRDVKPANVLLDGDRVVLTDFGIAMIEGGTALIATNQLIGSPQYLAPERINGQPAGPPSDLWALGVTLYLALTGRSPFQREDAQAVLAAVLTKNPPQVPGALGAVITGLLRKDPARRLTTADAVPLLDPGTRPVLRSRPRPLAGRRRPVAVALTVVVVLAIAAVVWTVWPPGSAADESAMARMTERGSVVVGVREDQPGLAYRKDGSLAGFDIEIATMIAGELGFGPDKITFTPVGEAERENALATGAVDMVVGTYPITEVSKQHVSFAGPYLSSAPSLLHRTGEQVPSSDLEGHTVCTVDGTASAQEVRNQGMVDPSDIVSASTVADCVDELLDKRVDAVVSDDIALEGYAAEFPDRVSVFGYSTTSVEYGIGLAHDDKQLRDEVNEILNGALNDGTWRDIYDRTLGRSGAEPGIPTVKPY
jgi:eukaryotic-like serine/threonine-protein kinase